MASAGESTTREGPKMESWHGEGWYKIGYSDEPSGA